FGAWVPLSVAAEQLPAGPGVLQVRLRQGLVHYPRGKSAMIHYTGGADVRRLAAELSRAHPDADWLCRTNIGPCADPIAAAERLRADFRDRFGAYPQIPESTDMSDR
ncbi:MAG TPA: hypothetical protein VIK91_11025, partial [Nannocystis sp.]